ncbi:selenocysteine-specific elongation factor [Clostridium tepidiprofundi DSM 19306]|uniref:Selenocysteine-specific elongation factor n=1 Tax=Clostridium tepidiprofundi DSM 19306 TaxID=1121338 RepID=A0A151B3L9_9CLOT|nr:selenocysteine-specific translation elongation factor [Clostridium tepidiprofundi]KYH34505.1 selenocysteine-specific elongation factor [Clostridium tepidiprofundi DSM 19306]
MKNVIIGTAGHIDHGKTTLIKALTGRETDTLKEEKKRGISINLGFTYFDLPSGKRAGIIDVPGHEKFIKNMLAGVSGVDAVLLVIAADEGIMPQTREHLEILQLLDVKKGIIVLTKADMVDDEWLSLVKEDIVEELKGTFLEKAPIHSVSSVTCQGIKELIHEIDNITEEIEAKDTGGHFRLPVDRAFSVSGFGTVVTGTIISGQVKLGDNVEVYPKKIITKVRGIQVHGKSADIGFAGQRCALNLSNVKVNDIGRGDVVAAEELMEPSMMIDCKLYYLKGMKKPLVNRQRVRLYHGTNEILCRVVLLDKEEIEPGESGYVQFRLESPLTAQRNDRYVIRSYSPMITIGGGSIIEPVAKKAKRFDEEYIEEIKLKESGTTAGILDNVIKKLSHEFPDKMLIIKSLGKNEENIEEKLEKLVEENKIICLSSMNKSIYIHKEFLEDKLEEIKKLLANYHKEFPLRVGMSKEEIKNRIFGKSIKQKVYDEILEIFQYKKEINVYDKFIALYDFNIKLDEIQSKMKENIINIYDKAKFSPPKFSDLLNCESDKNNFKMVYEMLIESEVLIKTSEDCVFLKKHYNNAIDIVVDYIKQNGSLTTSVAREILNTNRKFAVSLLENFDNLKITKRVGNERVLF